MLNTGKRADAYTRKREEVRVVEGKRTQVKVQEGDGFIVRGGNEGRGEEEAKRKIVACKRRWSERGQEEDGFYCDS